MFANRHSSPIEPAEKIASEFSCSTGRAAEGPKALIRVGVMDAVLCTTGATIARKPVIEKRPDTHVADGRIRPETFPPPGAP